MNSEELMEAQDTGADLCDAYTDRLKKKFIINDKTMDEWWVHFSLDFQSEELTPEYCSKLDAKLARLYAEASYFLTVINATVNFMEKGGETLYRTKYAELVEEWKSTQSGKIPAAATLESLAKLEQDELYSALTKAKTGKEFWKQILHYLDTCRKLIDNATFNSNVEAKLSRTGEG